MIKLAKVIDKDSAKVSLAQGTDTDWFISQGYSQLEVKQSDIDFDWYLAEKCPMKTDEQKAQEQAERTAMLKLTRGDVFRALLLAKGVTREQIKMQLEAMPMSTKEEKISRELALIDFDEALDFYRGNPLIDTVGLGLGITKQQLDEFFETNDYTKLM